jgi:DNA polymerase III subunit delta
VKFGVQDLARFLRRPDPRIEAVLCYGPDAGLARERALLLSQAAVPDRADPFRLAELSPAALLSDPALLFDEARQWSLLGGKRVLSVRDAGDALAPLLKRLFAASEKEGGEAERVAFITVEAGELGPRSALRRAFEESRTGAAIACYPDTERDLSALVRETASAHRLRLSRDAEAYLVAHLGGDRLLSRSELEKLALYAGEGGAIGLDDARAVVGDSAAVSLDDAVLAAAEGDARGLQRALARVLEEGESPVSVLRALLRHLLRLHAFLAEIAAGKSPEAALRAARPPIFFKHMENWKRQLGLWSEPRLREALAALDRAELLMKSTGFPAATLLREAMLATARRARPAADDRPSA